MRGIIKKMRFTDHIPTDYPQQPLRRCDEYWSAEGRGMNGEDKEIEDDDTYHGEM